MDAEYANYYTREVMLILIREFQSPDEEMKKIVLKVCCSFSAKLYRSKIFHCRNFTFCAEFLPGRYLKYFSRNFTFIALFQQVVKQCCATDGVEPQYIKTEILPPFFKHFWNQRMALDRRNYRQLVDTTVEIANKVRIKKPIF